MQIQIKENELLQAIKLYLASMGLNVAGKKVDAVFSMTRKPAGITADVQITEVFIPGFSDTAAEAVAEVVRQEPVLVVDNAIPVGGTSVETTEDVIADEQVQEQTEKKPTTSLFQ
jgi:hypothetical protein